MSSDSSSSSCLSLDSPPTYSDSIENPSKTVSAVTHPAPRNSSLGPPPHTANAAKFSSLHPSPPQLPFQLAGNPQPPYAGETVKTHQRKTSQTSVSTPPSSQELYLHGNYTVDNYAHQCHPSQTSNSSNGSTSLSFAERKMHSERIYGRIPMSSSSSLFTEGVFSARSSFVNLQPSYLPDPLKGHSEEQTLERDFEIFLPSAPQSPSAMQSLSHSGTNQVGIISALSSQDADFEIPSMPNFSESARHPLNATESKLPPLANNYAMVKDFYASPKVIHAEALSPADLVFHSERQAWSTASSQHTAPFVSPSRQAKKRDTFGFLTRLGSRISSGFSSRASSGFGFRSQNASRAGSKAGSRAGSSMSMCGFPDIMPALSDLVLNDENWPYYSPKRDPSDEVLEQISHLGGNGMPITDINLAAKTNPMLLSQIPARSDDAREAQKFMPRGLFYHSDFSGAMDNDGNYNPIEGEHLGFRYSVVGPLGKGSFGTVLKCRDHKSGRMVSVKVTTKKPELLSQVKVEASLLRSLLVDHHGHPELNHFVRYVEHFQFRGHMCIATELLGPNLYELLKRNGHQGLEESTVRYITRQLCEGLEFLASQKIIHCDIKPENILIGDISKCQVKIIDFGSGCYEGKRLYTYIQSRFYRAPEILLGMPYATPIDMWSLGTIVPELLLGRPLFPSSDEQDQVALMAQVLGSPPPTVIWRSTRSALFFDVHNVPLQLVNAKGERRLMPGSTPLRDLLSAFSEEALSFCENTLCWSPEKRLKADRAVYHPFVISQ